MSVCTCQQATQSRYIAYPASIRTTQFYISSLKLFSSGLTLSLLLNVNPAALCDSPTQSCTRFFFDNPTANAPTNVSPHPFTLTTSSFSSTFVGYNLTYRPPTSWSP